MHTGDYRRRLHWAGLAYIIAAARHEGGLYGNGNMGCLTDLDSLGALRYKKSGLNSWYKLKVQTITYRCFSLAGGGTFRVTPCVRGPIACKASRGAVLA